MLPKTIKLETDRGNQEIEVKGLGAVDVPEGDGGAYASELTGSGWDGYTRDAVPNHLATWIPAKKTREIAQRVEQALEDGIPDQRRRMLRNQDFGMLDDRFVCDIALGDEVERPFSRWANSKAGECRVAICIDTASSWRTDKGRDAARQTIAAGMAMALEGLDYEVSIVAAMVCSRTPGGLPRTRRADGPYVHAITVKDASESYVGSSFAHLAETGLSRLVTCWAAQSNGYGTPLTDAEWREMTGADLFVYIGDQNGRLNTSGKPAGAKVGIHGEDVLPLTVNSDRDIDSAIEKVEAFFTAMAE